MKTKEIPKLKSWPKRPLIFEINTWVWLQERMGAYNFNRERIIMELVEDHTVK